MFNYILENNNNYVFQLLHYYQFGPSNFAVSLIFEFPKCIRPP
jgi:hypothetical protein